MDNSDSYPYAVMESAARELSDELSIVLSSIELVLPFIPDSDVWRKRCLLEAQRAAWGCAQKAAYLNQAVERGPRLPAARRLLSDLVLTSTPKETPQ